MESRRTPGARHLGPRVAGLVVLLFATACESPERRQELRDGGEQRAEAGAAVVRGGVLAGAAAQALDARDLELAFRAYRTGLEEKALGAPANWTNPASGHSGSLTPTRRYENARGQFCREYLEVVVTPALQRQAYGAVCRRSDGRWSLAGQD